MSAIVDMTLPVERVALHPGWFLKEKITEAGVSQKHFAESISISPQYLNDVIQGRRAISVQLAIKLERRLNLPARFWLEQQMEHDLFMAELPGLVMS